MAQYWEQSRARKDMVVAENAKDRARCNLPAPKNVFRVVPGVIDQNASTDLWFVQNASRPARRHAPAVRTAGTPA